MGIQDRDYYRNSSSGSFGEFLGGQSAAAVFVALHACVFLLQIATNDRGHPGEFTRAIVFDSDSIRAGEVWRLLTGPFASPPSILYVICNLYVLWWAGNELCAIYGNREFTAFYIASALFASSAAFLVGLLADGANILWLATAPVVAVLTLFACHFPRRTIMLFFVIPVPVAFVVFLLAAKDFLFLNQKDHAVEAVPSLAAVFFGFVYHRFQWRISPILTGLNFFAAPNHRKANLRLYRERETSRVGTEFPPEAPVSLGSSTGPVTDEQLEARLDVVLDKVQKQGQASLTPEERELLFRASELYKRRRRAD